MRKVLFLLFSFFLSIIFIFPEEGVNTGANLQFSTGMELQVHGLKEVNDSHFHPVLHPV